MRPLCVPGPGDVESPERALCPAETTLTTSPRRQRERRPGAPTRCSTSAVGDQDQARRSGRSLATWRGHPACHRAPRGRRGVSYATKRVHNADSPSYHARASRCLAPETSDILLRWSGPAWPAGLGPLLPGRPHPSPAHPRGPRGHPSSRPALYMEQTRVLVSKPAHFRWKPPASWPARARGGAHGARAREPDAQSAVRILPLLLIGCVSLGRVQSPSGPQFHLGNGKVCPPGC